VPRRAVRIFPTLRTLANFLESDTEPLQYNAPFEESFWDR
jgi:hypothetical protein